MARMKNADVPVGWLTVAQAARALGKSEGTVRGLIRTGKVASKRYGSERGPYVVSQVDIEKILGGEIDPTVQVDPDAEPTGREVGPEVPEDVMTVLDELGGIVSVVQINRKRKGKYLYLDEFDVDAFSLRMIEETYGGGEYQARFKDADGQYVKSKNFGIEGDPKVKAVAPPTVEGGLVEVLREFMSDMRAELRERSAPQANPVEMAVEMAKMLQAESSRTIEMMKALLPQPGAGVKDMSLKDALEVLNTGIELGQAMKGGADATDTSIMGMAGEIVSFLKSKRQEGGDDKKPALPPAAQPNPNDPGWVQLLRPWFPQLMALATNKRNPDIYGPVVIDQMADAELQTLGEQLDRGEAFGTDFYQYFPEAAPLRWWFDSFMDVLRGLITVEDEEIEAEAPADDI